METLRLQAVKPTASARQSRDGTYVYLTPQFPAPGTPWSFTPSCSPHAQQGCLQLGSQPRQPGCHHPTIGGRVTHLCWAPWAFWLCWYLTWSTAFTTQIRLGAPPSRFQSFELCLPLFLQFNHPVIVTPTWSSLYTHVLCPPGHYGSGVVWPGLIINKVWPRIREIHKNSLWNRRLTDG